MPVAYAGFITAFPEFGNVTAYPQSQIEFWLAQAYQQLNARRFGTSLDMAAMLFTAHNVVLSARATRVAAGGGDVGAPTGLQTSKAVGPVSASYDVTATTSAGAGIYNATSYGQRLWALIKAFSAGPMYVPGPRQTSPYPYPYGVRGF